MGLEFGKITGLWLGREDGGWEPVDGVTSVERNEEAPPLEDTTAFATEFGVTKLARWVPTCPGGVHQQHPGYTCEEHEALAASFQDLLESLITDAYAQAARRAQDVLAEFLAGVETWEPRGLTSLGEQVDPTPIERALQILAPHLARIPPYQPGDTCADH
ncbi:hypothetical protein QBB34_33985 [Streptomyces stelliscabiei]|uniref:hypothetical protein n=1 Tax=Streptomyces stelliscabiei TaxID=146820 RepID=UPI002FF205FE